MKFLFQLLYRGILTPKAVFAFAKARHRHGSNAAFLLHFASICYSDKIYLTNGNLRYSFKDTYKLVLKLSALLQQKISGTEALVIFPCANSVQHVIVLFALQNLGIKTILVHYKIDKLTVDIIAQQQQASEIYLLSDTIHSTEKIISISPEMLWDEMKTKTVSPYAGKQNSPILFSTSGTTGSPKVIPKKEGAIYWFRSFADLVLFTKVYRYQSLLLAAPVAHSLGYSILAFSTVLGKKNFLPLPNSEVFLPAMINDEEIDIVAGTPAGLYQVATQLENHRHNIKIIISGGASLSQTIFAKISQILSSCIFSLYGSTEASTSFIADYSLLEKNCNAIGRPLYGIKYQVTALPDGSTELFILSHLANVHNKKWLATGDLVGKTAEGDLLWLGRKDDMIIKYGVNIYPAEIENILLQLQDIEDVLVTGQQDELAGQVIVAFIKTKNNRPPNRDVISEKLKQQLSSLKQPDKIMQVHKFEYSSTGKKIKLVSTELRDAAAV